MLRRIVPAASLLAVLAAAACSASDTTAPGADCASAMKVACAQAFACAGQGSVTVEFPGDTGGPSNDTQDGCVTGFAGGAGKSGLCAVLPTPKAGWAACQSALAGGGTCGTDAFGRTFTLADACGGSASPTPDGGSDGGGGCSTVNRPGPIAAVSLQLAKINLGDENASGTVDSQAWKSIGANIDGLCSDKTSTDVCTKQQGASSATQVDGDNGTDNAWAAVFIPLLQALSTQDVSATAKAPSYLVIDAQGAGTLVVDLGFQLRVPLLDAHVSQSGATGQLSGVIDPEAFLLNLKQGLGAVSPSLCGAAFDTLAAQVRQASDLLLDGSNGSGKACTGISIGITFDGATPFSGSLPALPQGC